MSQGTGYRGIADGLDFSLVRNDPDRADEVPPDHTSPLIVE
ncbi:hypothetical protein [Cupriavidus pauculus]|nr:hypothetical protein [Cupriavidus pauculus]